MEAFLTSVNSLQEQFGEVCAEAEKLTLRLRIAEEKLSEANERTAEAIRRAEDAEAAVASLRGEVGEALNRNFLDQPSNKPGREKEAAKQANAASATSSVEGGVASGSAPAAAPAALSFGHSAPSATAKPFSAFSFGHSAPSATAKPFNGFSFGGAPAAPEAAVAKPFNGFSFGDAAPAAPKFCFASPPSPKRTISAPAPSLFGAVPLAPSEAAGRTATSAEENDDADNELVEVKREKNKDETVIFEVQTNHLKIVEGKWKRFGVGTVKLYRNNKDASKCRIIKRNNATGKVDLNLSVTKGMKFTKLSVKKAHYVGFGAMESEKRGVEAFKLQVNPNSLDKLHAKLEEMAA